MRRLDFELESQSPDTVCCVSFAFEDSHTSAKGNSTSRNWQPAFAAALSPSASSLPWHSPSCWSLP
eukprot:5577819-Prymnesium_polylepis.2